MNCKQLDKYVRKRLRYFIIGLVVSGTAILLIGEGPGFLLQAVPLPTAAGRWSATKLPDYETVQQPYPFMLYGYD